MQLTAFSRKLLVKLFFPFPLSLSKACTGKEKEKRKMDEMIPGTQQMNTRRGQWKMNFIIIVVSSTLDLYKWDPCFDNPHH